MTDVALIRQAAAGNRTVQGELARASFHRVLAYCQSRVFQLADAEELAEESLIRAMVDLPALSEPTAYGAWLRGIANHVCSDWHRRQRRAPQNELMDQAASPEADPADEVAIADERMMLQGQMRELPEELREVLLLFYYEDYSYDEIAAWLGVARATVSERVTFDGRPEPQSRPVRLLWKFAARQKQVRDSDKRRDAVVRSRPAVPVKSILGRR